MQSLELYEINHVDFSSRFKTIRKEKDTHLGQYALMKDKEANKRVIVKHQPFQSEQDLQLILEGIASHLILNDCPSIVRFLGYSIKGKIISLIYENHESTLEQSLKGINNKSLSDKSLQTFLLNMIEALTFLESLNLNHLDIKPSNILQQNKETLNNCFKLFYTHYTSDSVSQIKALNTPIESYFLSSIQLDSINSQQIQLSFEDKIHSDIQSLGLICLWLGTTNIKDKFYQYNEEDELEINQDCIAKRIKEFRKNYSKKTIRILEILLGGQEDTFNDILNVITSESSMKNKKQVTITEENEEKQKSSREHSLQKFDRFNNAKSFDQSKHYSSIKNEDSSFVEPSARRKYYLQNLNEIEQKIIYRPGTKQLFPNMEEKQYADGSYYIGQLSSTKQRQGKGIYYYSEGDVYAGDWKDNTLQGYGIYLFSNGQKYEGGVERGVKLGKGQYIYCNNNKYEGQWFNDKKHGYGIYLYQNKGERYQGQFKNGMKEGTGMFYYSNQDKYQGGFYHGDKHGNGVAKYHNGTKVTGVWQNGELNGNAFVEYNNGDQSTAQIIKGIKNGQGNYVYQNSTEFEGCYQNNAKTGNCMIQYHNGDKYKGNLFKGKRDGEGTYEYANQTSYSGEWKDNQRHGKGEFRYPNGTIVSGYWSHSNLNNPCTIKYPNGDVYEGTTTKLIVKEGQGNYFFSSGQKLQGQFKNGTFIKGILVDERGNKTVV